MWILLNLGHYYQEIPFCYKLHGICYCAQYFQHIKVAVTFLLVGEAVKSLLFILTGISVDSSFRYGWTPLMYAASVSNVELVRVLLDRGANASFDKGKMF